MTDKTPPTPGPWIVFNDGDHPGIESISVGKTIVFCGEEITGDACGIRGRSSEEAFANARLIAAAPEMFAVLVEIIKRDEDHPVTRLAQFAYEKAVYGS